jgi:pectin methylesterase-like acyl-CoA thioesterase
MISIKPVTLNFVPAPSAPKHNEYPVLVVDKNGQLNESWHVWSKMGRSYSQLTTNKSIVEIVGWTSLNARIKYEKQDDSETTSEKDYITWESIDRKKQKNRNKRGNKLG